MKNYVQTLTIISLIIVSFSYFNFICSGQQTTIVAMGRGPDSLVDAIKQYSDITEADVNKWNFLWLGRFNAVPALAASGYSAFKVGKVTGKLVEEPPVWLNKLPTTPEFLKDYVPVAPDLLSTAMPWMVVAAAATGFVGYKFFYPRVRHGIINKVQNFLDMCDKLTVAKTQVYVVADIPEWNKATAIAVCRAFDNLEQQAAYAEMLLRKVGADESDVDPMLVRLNAYYGYLHTNKNYWNNYCKEQEIAEEKKEAGDVFLEGVKLQNRANLLSMVRNAWKLTKDVVTTGKDVVGWTIENKGSITSLLTAGWFAKWLFGK